MKPYPGILKDTKVNKDGKPEQLQERKSICDL